jgi:hypothetical protein
MARQPIKYAGTEIEAIKSATEIMSLLVRYGGEQTTFRWEAGQPVGR